MSHPASRWSAAATVTIVLALVAWLIAGGPATSALAAFAEPLLNAKTARFKLTARNNDQVVAVANLLVSGTRMRTETSTPDKTRTQIDILDADADVSVTLLPDEKLAEIRRYKNRPANLKEGGFLDEIRKLLGEDTKREHVKRESLGERDVDGLKLVGFRLTTPATVLEIWGDPATGRPHSLVQTMAVYPGITSTMSEFAFDEPFDPALLSLEPPAGYQVTERDVDVSPPTEAALVAALRMAAELNDGNFPDSLDMEVGHNLVKIFRKDQGGKLSDDELAKRSEELTLTFSRGFGFALRQPVDRRGYLGKGIKLDTPDTAVFWYQPEDGKNYRVIYADLSVKESDTKPASE